MSQFKRAEIMELNTSGLECLIQSFVFLDRLSEKASKPIAKLIADLKRNASNSGLLIGGFQRMIELVAMQLFLFDFEPDKEARIFALRHLSETLTISGQIDELITPGSHNKKPRLQLIDANLNELMRDL
ncbi:hypothetical protein C0081_10400 [Cohaesibacter celericrescens]|uniref:Uncharacterized protein n=2 Tax=Cohaesibacter celericrescens TaxID=2067669 RepID=A0A2N5XT66_9HYPH|nr:hypothetical protein C0081_10400 [Cohaesibacter celericrescens]